MGKLKEIITISLGYRVLTDRRRNINNTLVYTHLVNFKDDDYLAKVADSEQEVCQLIGAGFEFVCDYA